ncbi:MAG: pyridoxamine 5'-phosphate oxidase family protein [Balneolaceae bacterium]
MHFTEEIRDSVHQSILCWLATSTLDNIPNVSPKEVFCTYQDSIILVANIASPQTVKNINANPHVCISFIDVFVQKGFQLKGSAEIIKHSDSDFDELSKPLLNITQGNYPFSSLTKIVVTSSKPIIAPSYKLFPEISEEDRIQSALKNYGVKKLS